MRISAAPALITATVASLAAGLIAGQALPPSGQGPTFRSRADVVQVDVVAVDKDGNAVRGLAARDFTLLDRKQPQPITTFEEVSRERPASTDPAPLASVKRDVASNHGAESDRLVVMVLDDLHLFEKRTARAQEIARTFLDDLGPQSTMSVLFTSQEHSIEPTDDRAELLAAIGLLKGRVKVPRPVRAPDSGKGRGSAQDFFDDMQIIKTLEDAARALNSGAHRRRAFVYVSEGLGRDFNGMFEGQATPCDLKMSGAPCYHDHALKNMMDAMQRGNVAVYAIDARGHVPREDFAKECRPSPPGPCDPCMGNCPGQSPEVDSWIRLAEFGLEIEAKASGGFAITNTDDVSAGLRRIVADLDHYYLLGFAPTDRGGGFRPIDVKVNRPGVTLRFRTGYDLAAPAAKTSDDPVAALASGPLPETGLDLRFTAAALPGRAAAPVSAAFARERAPATPDTRIVMGLEVSLPQKDGPEALLEADDAVRYTVIAVDLAKKKAVRQFTNKATVTSGGGGTTQTVQLPAEFTLPPGRYQLRASAMSTNLERGGSVYLAFDVPDFRSPPLAMSSIFVGYAEGPHVAVGAGPAGSRSDPSSVPFPQTLDRAFTVDDTLRVYFEVATRSAGATPAARVEILDANGASVRSSAPPLDAASGSRVCDTKLPLAGLAPGAYVLRATATDTSGAPVRRDVGFVIKP